MAMLHTDFQSKKNRRRPEMINWQPERTWSFKRSRCCPWNNEHAVFWSWCRFYVGARQAWQIYREQWRVL